MRCHWSSASSSLLLILLFFEPLSAQSGEFSLEQVMSAGFPSEMTAAPVGGAVAWVINERGVRNIWIARAPDYRGRQLTRYKNSNQNDLDRRHLWKVAASGGSPLQITKGLRLRPSSWSAGSCPPGTRLEITRNNN